MARIPLVTEKSQVPPEYHGLFDTIVETRGGIRGPLATQFHIPQLLEITEKLGAYLRFHSPLSQDVVELTTIAVAREMDSPYEWAAHAPLARKCGVREEAIQAIKQGTAPEGLTEDEAMLVRYVQQLHRDNKVDQPTFDAVTQRFGLQGSVALTALVGHYMMVAVQINAFEITPDPGSDMLPV